MKKMAKNPITQRKDITNPALDAEQDINQRAKSVLAMMKELEAERKEKMVEYRLDRHTIIRATPVRLIEIKKKLK